MRCLEIWFKHRHSLVWWSFGFALQIVSNILLFKIPPFLNCLQYVSIFYMILFFFLDVLALIWGDWLGCFDISILNVLNWIFHKYMLICHLNPVKLVKISGGLFFLRDNLCLLLSQLSLLADFYGFMSWFQAPCCNEAQLNNLKWMRMSLNIFIPQIYP